MGFNISYTTEVQKDKAQKWLVEEEVPWLCDNPVCGFLLGLSDPQKTVLVLRRGKDYEIAISQGKGTVVAHTCRRCKKLNVLGSD